MNFEVTYFDKELFKEIVEGVLVERHWGVANLMNGTSRFLITAIFNSLLCMTRNSNRL